MDSCQGSLENVAEPALHIMGLHHLQPTRMRETDSPDNCFPGAADKKQRKAEATEVLCIALLSCYIAVLLLDINDKFGTEETSFQCVQRSLVKFSQRWCQDHKQKKFLALQYLKLAIRLEFEGSDNKVECLRIRGKANRSTTLVGVCYIPPNQDNEVDKLFYKQLADTSRSLALVLVGDFNLSDFCWELKTVEKRQSRWFLKCMEDNFLLQLMNGPNTDGALLDLLFTEGLLRDAGVGGLLGHHDHEMMEFSTPGETRRGINKTFMLDFWKADLGLFRMLIQTVPWEIALKNKGFQEGWTYFKKEILKVQEQTVPMCQKMSLQGR
ncbi:adaptin ear-binding coat-associated protein 1 [Willisornis vidua]|uniref:Adaptin ear-binding coat-associated protein 1 n=1 Tax=Willisornis vidua TaxID=1566151 RepID=A0ABQ9DCC1_9PASS|nr:adaptin ear-binding coat-associated protein 1 [Willisornis vidua]